MGVQVYRSTDSGAPALNSTNGTMINVLDACLVNGYGSKSPPGNWIKAYSGTNKAAYRSTHSLASGFYLRVQDDTPVAGKYSAMVRGYETMTDVDTGTNEFPRLTVRGANDFFWNKASSTSGNRDWTIVADERFFHIAVQPSSATSYPNYYHCFGDPIPLRPVDIYSAFISAGWDYTGGWNSAQWHSLSNNNSPGYLCRGLDTDLPSSIYRVFPQGHHQAANPVGPGYTGGIILYRDLLPIGPLYIAQTSGGYLRCKIPGFYAPLVDTPFAVNGFNANMGGSLFPGLSGRELTVLRTPPTNSAVSPMHEVWLDATGPWR